METPGAGTPAGATTNTETVSATRVAAETGDVSTFLQVDRDARLGKSHEPVTRERKADAAPAKKAEKPNAEKWSAPADKGAEKPADKAAAAKGPSPADREADDRIRRIVGDAVSTATAHARREIDELRGRLAQATGGGKPLEAKPADTPATTDTPKRLTKAEIANYQAMPDAPKLDDKDPTTGEFLYDTASEHAIALADFIREEKSKVAAQDTQRRDSLVARSHKEAERVKNFGSRIEKWKAAHADRLVDRVVRGADGTEKTIKAIPLSPEVAQLHGWAMLSHLNQQRRASGQEPLPPTVDHAIAERLYDSEAETDVAVYLSQHPTELAYLRAATNEGDLAARFGRIEERASGGKPATQPAAATGGDGKPTTKTASDAKREAERAVERSVSSAKPPETTLGKGTTSADPIEQALKDGDVGLFLELDRQARIERAGFHRTKR